MPRWGPRGTTSARTAESDRVTETQTNRVTENNTRTRPSPGRGGEHSWGRSPGALGQECWRRIAGRARGERRCRTPDEVRYELPYWFGALKESYFRRNPGGEWQSKDIGPSCAGRVRGKPSRVEPTPVCSARWGRRAARLSCRSWGCTVKAHSGTERAKTKEAFGEMARKAHKRSKCKIACKWPSTLPAKMRSSSGVFVVSHASTGGSKARRQGGRSGHVVVSGGTGHGGAGDERPRQPEPRIPLLSGGKDPTLAALFDEELFALRRRRAGLHDPAQQREGGAAGLLGQGEAGGVRAGAFLR